MMNENKHFTELRQERKKILIRNGAMHRDEISKSKEIVRTGLRPEALAKQWIHQLKQKIVGNITLNINGKASTLSSGLLTLLPMIVNGIPALARNRPMRRAITTTVILGAASIVTYFLLGKKNKTP